MILTSKQSAKNHLAGRNTPQSPFLLLLAPYFQAQCFPTWDPRRFSRSPQDTLGYFFFNNSCLLSNQKLQNINQQGLKLVIQTEHFDTVSVILPLLGIKGAGEIFFIIQGGFENVNGEKGCETQLQHQTRANNSSSMGLGLSDLTFS